MKFELEPYNRGQSDETMLDDLRSVAQSLGKDFVTKDEYNRHGRFCAATLQKRFGSWTKAHEIAGLKRIRRFGVTDEECVESLKEVAHRLGKTTLTASEYRQNGGLSLRIIYRELGPWRVAVERAGLTGARGYRGVATTDEELFENVETLWRMLGRQPRSADFSEPFSRVSLPVYKRRFGGLRKALEAFVDTIATRQDEEAASDAPDVPSASPAVVPALVRHRTSRNVGWRLRFLVMRRDGFRCRACGTTPALRPGTMLVVDHVHPWSDGGETEMDNLQTLCEPCNGGKSDLPMD